ncbi:MAG TPA: hypothetical protein VIT91_13015 [Chthoniobacterales bacterium]
MEDDFKELQRLLRLKKYEQPPAGYPERFLKEFHRRQRWEASRKTGFAALREKVGEWVGAITIPKYAYAGTFGVFAAAAIAINSFIGSPTSHPLTASSGNAGVPSAPVSNVIPPSALVLNGQLDVSALDTPFMNQGSVIQDSRPRYILESRPASYEAPFSF